MLISEKAHDANVRNAQKSTGPKTPEGKAAVRFNAYTYGLRTRETLLPDENAADYFRLWDEFEAEWHPIGRTEYTHLEDMVQSQWLLRRLADSEARIWCDPDPDTRFKTLSYVAKQRASLERTFHKAIQVMRQSQKERRQRKAQPLPQQPEQPQQPAQPEQTIQPKPLPELPPHIIAMAESAEPVFTAAANSDTR